jgi:glucose/arabinose dehydrogenase
MSRTRASLFLPVLLIIAGAVAIVTDSFVRSQGARAAEALTHYNGNSKQYWEHPPADWYMADENAEQTGERPYPPQPLPTPYAELVKLVKENIKLPPGFQIEVWASGVHQARQMAWGDDGTLYVGAWNNNVYAITSDGGKRTAKVIITGLRMPTGVAFWNGNLYVVDIDKIYRYADIDKTRDNPKQELVYSDFPPYTSHGWKYIVADPQMAGWFYIPVGPPCNICLPPSGTSQYRHINPDAGWSEVVAIGIRNSVGGAVDPRSGELWFTENARDWVSDSMPSDKLNRVARYGEHFGYPYCHQGDFPDPKYSLGHKCDEFTPPVINLGAHMAPLGMKFYDATAFPAPYRNNIFIAEHGGWNQRIHTGAWVVRVVADTDGRHAAVEPFAWGWIKDNKYWGRPDDVAIMPQDGSLLVSDDQAGAIYRIWYAGK